MTLLFRIFTHLHVMDTAAQHLASPPEAYKWGNLMGSGKLSEEVAVEQNMALLGQVS